MTMEERKGLKEWTSKGCVCARSLDWFCGDDGGAACGPGVRFFDRGTPVASGFPTPSQYLPPGTFFFCADGRYFFRFSHQSFRLAAGHRVPVHPLYGTEGKVRAVPTYLQPARSAAQPATTGGRPVPAPPCLFRFRHRPLARHGSPSTCSSTIACHSRRSHWRSAAGPWRPAGTPPPPSVACLSLTLPGLGFQVSVAAASLRVPASPPCKSLCPAVAATPSPLHGPHRNSDCLPDRQPRGGLQRGSISGSATKRGSRAPTLRRRDVAVAFHCPSFSNPLSPRAPARRNSSPARGCRACGPE